MKTGSTTVTIDGDSYNFYFSKSGGVEGRGKGVSGIDDGKYIYMYGCKIKADSDDKYQVVKVTEEKGDLSTGSSLATVEKIKSIDLRNSDNAKTTSQKNSDDEHVRYIPTK